MALNVPGYSLTPNQNKVALPSNYLGSADFDFLNQYMPDIYEKEFARYGNRTIASFLRSVSAEVPFSSDLIKWSEQGRLHTKYTGLTHGTYSAGTEIFTVASGTCNFRVNQTVFLSGSLGASAKGIVTATTSTTFTVAYYTVVVASPFAAAETVTAFVYGSEFQKGTNGMVGGLTPVPDIFDAKPVIIKDKFVVSGSDMAQIGWIQIQTEDGTTGYLWYMKALSETRLRFDDYLEMMMVEHSTAETSSAAETFLGGAPAGSEGMFDAIRSRGNTWSGGNPSTLADFDTIVSRLDKQGAIPENAIFLNRQFAFDVDDMLASQSVAAAGGVSYGLFDNSEEMALNLGFKGFKRGSYDFYKTDWKYLNDATLRGALTGGSVNGVMIPAGTTNVKDMVTGEGAKRPFLHVRYRQSATENRRLKTWTTGSAGGGQATSDLDAMNVEFLSERALCVLGANNFFIMED